MQVIQRRQNFELSDPETSAMIQSIIGRLDKQDVDKLDVVRNKVIKYKGTVLYNNLLEFGPLGLLLFGSFSAHMPQIYAHQILTYIVKWQPF